MISHKTQVPYLGIILSYHDYEMKTLKHRMAASKTAMGEVAHAVRNHRVISEKRRKSTWTITARASVVYALHVVELTQQGLSKLQAHMMYQLRFVLRSYSQETRETNQESLPQHNISWRLRPSQFIKRQAKSDPTLTPLYMPRAERLLASLQQLAAPEGVQSSQDASY